MADTFPTRAEAMDYIVATLPNATAENPKYLTKADGTVSAWLTESVSFTADAAAAMTATMREKFTQSQADTTTRGEHEAKFSLAEVAVGELTAPWDVTPTGEPAKGLLFTCLQPGCVAAKWGDAHSRADKADLYVQDAPTRARLLAAFRRLQAP